MLFDSVLNLIITVVNYFVSLLPDATISDNVSSAVATASNYLSALDIIIPAYTLTAIIGIFLIVEGAINGIKLFNWFIRKIPGIS